MRDRNIVRNMGNGMPLALYMVGLYLFNKGLALLKNKSALANRMHKFMKINMGLPAMLMSFAAVNYY